MSNEQNANVEHIFILDFGSQYSQLLAQRVRDNQTYCAIVPSSISASEIKARNPIGLILSGSSSSVGDADAPQVDPEIFKLGVPILGVGYGFQVASKFFGATVTTTETRECGPDEMTLGEEGLKSPLFEGMSKNSQVWASRGDQTAQTTDDFVTLASTATCPNAAVQLKSIPFYGVQFHPEVERTTEGARLLTNFVVNICKSSRSWTPQRFVASAIESIRAQVGQERVICGLSGGVDSAVVAALVSRAVGSQLTCIFVDTGMMRKNEIADVAEVFRKNFDANLVVVDAEERFLSLLEGVDDPQQKRKIIGKTFIDVFSEEATKISGAKFLAQGTIYPDIIESGGKKGAPSATIKFHHNVGGLPDDLEFELIEPLRELFKGDVRRAGLELGLPEEIVWRHPFPGPGLAVRCLGAVTKESLDCLREADAIVVDEIVAAGLYRETSQAFAVLLPVRSVGMTSEGRTYENAIAVRSVSTVDFMTADWSRLPYEVLARISSRIINEVKGVNRVVYDISSKPPATIEWE
ncbi:MAG: glutamine-hydrolyzing GMP synthase [Thermoguttaceae bacterium]|jgi:GMP synthase (glutamine-hydrolysing)